MRREDTWRIVAGAVALLIVAGLLFSTPSMIFVRKVDIIDTELRESTGGSQRVLAKVDFNNPKELAQIPRQLGPWNLSRQYDWDRVATILNSDVLLSRDYARADVFQPVNLLIIESLNVSSFHPAPVCYRAQGYEVPANEGKAVVVNIPNITWAQQQWLMPDEHNIFSGNMSAKLLEVTKKSPNGTVTEKRVALYAYLKRQDWRVTDQVTWLRLEMVVSPSETGEDVLPILSSLMSEVVPNLFNIKETKEVTLGETLVDRWGVAGGALILGAVVVPCLPIATAIRNVRRPS